MAAEGDKIFLFDVLVYCLRALKWLQFPMPWSREFQTTRSAVGKMLWGMRQALLTYGNARRKRAEVAMNTSACVDGINISEVAELARLDPVLTRNLPENRPADDVTTALEAISVEFLPSESTEDAQRRFECDAALRTLSIAVLAYDDIDYEILKYAVWACARESNGEAPPENSPLGMAHRRLNSELQSGKVRGKGIVLRSLMDTGLRLPDRFHLVKSYERNVATGDSDG